MVSRFDKIHRPCKNPRIKLDFCDGGFFVARKEENMVTRVELVGPNLERYLNKKGIQPKGDSFVVGRFPDRAGKYKSATGLVGLEFALANRGNNREVVLFCQEEKILQRRGEQREVRRVHVDRNGKGMQQLTKGVELHVSTQASLPDFEANTR